MVGGTGLKELPYAGGEVSYEGYEFSIAPTKLTGISGGVKISPTYVPLSDVKITSKVIDIVKSVPKGKSISRTGLRTRLEEDLGAKVIGVLKPVLKEKVTTIQKIRLRQAERLGLKLKLEPKLKTGFRPIQPKPTPRPIPKPTYIYIPKLPEGSKIKLKLPKKTKEKELITPFIKRRGKWFAIAKPTTKRKALKKGISKLRRSLAASLQLRKTSGGVIPFGKETQEFRFGKKGKETFTLVQRAPKRLSARQEVSEIIASRRAGGTRFL